MFYFQYIESAQQGDAPEPALINHSARRMSPAPAW